MTHQAGCRFFVLAEVLVAEVAKVVASMWKGVGLWVTFRRESLPVMAAVQLVTRKLKLGTKDWVSCLGTG